MSTKMSVFLHRCFQTTRHPFRFQIAQNWKKLRWNWRLPILSQPFANIFSNVFRSFVTLYQTKRIQLLQSYTLNMIIRCIENILIKFAKKFVPIKMKRMEVIPRFFSILYRRYPGKDVMATGKHKANTNIAAAGARTKNTKGEQRTYTHNKSRFEFKWWKADQIWWYPLDMIIQTAMEYYCTHRQMGTQGW